MSLCAVKGKFNYSRRKMGKKNVIKSPLPILHSFEKPTGKKGFAATLWGFISVIDVSRDFRYDCAWALSGNVCAIASDGLQKSRPRMIDSYRSAPPYTPLCALPVQALWWCCSPVLQAVSHCKSPVRLF